MCDANEDKLQQFVQYHLAGIFLIDLKAGQVMSTSADNQVMTSVGKKTLWNPVSLCITI